MRVRHISRNTSGYFVYPGRQYFQVFVDFAPLFHGYFLVFFCRVLLSFCAGNHQVFIKVLQFRPFHNFFFFHIPAYIKEYAAARFRRQVFRKIPVNHEHFYFLKLYSANGFYQGCILFLFGRDAVNAVVGRMPTEFCRRRAFFLRPHFIIVFTKGDDFTVVVDDQLSRVMYIMGPCCFRVKVLFVGGSSV